MPVTHIGVRHHSPACARLVERTIDELRPAYVLIEGPADFNDRIDELLLDHDLPIAIFASYRDDQRHHATWAPLCDYSPEWVAIRHGAAVGATVKFIDLPSWDEAFIDRSNRWSDAERRYRDASERLCREFAVDNIDALWDHLVERDQRGGPELAVLLAEYFDGLRGDAEASAVDTTREAYMASWVAAAANAAGGDHVVVVTGGFHRSPMLAMTAETVDGANEPVPWPVMPSFPDDATGGSFLVPFSFKRLDSFDGYQSGMPSPGYYQRVWEDGIAGAAEGLVQDIATALRERRQVVSTADLVAATALSHGLARLRNHDARSRTDVLDGMAAALVTDALDQPLPWSRRGTLVAGTDPVVVEMVRALSGQRVGTLDPATPLPPLVHDVAAELERHGLVDGAVEIDLAEPSDLARSRVLHRLRVLRIPGFVRDLGPTAGDDPQFEESWSIRAPDHRLTATIEAGSYGASLIDAALAALRERVGQDPGNLVVLGDALFDAALCGIHDLGAEAFDEIHDSVRTTGDLPGLGRVIAVSLGLWRHDALFGARGQTSLVDLVGLGVDRAVWLIEGVRGGPSPADPGRIATIAAVRDALRHARAEIDMRADTVVALAHRVAGATDVPPDLRGATFGLAWSLGRADDITRAVRGVGRPELLGDWLAGLFGVAREDILGEDGAVLGVLDELIAGMAPNSFDVALPSLRNAFSFFPPRERERIARAVLARHESSASPTSLLRIEVDPILVETGRLLEREVVSTLAAEGLLTGADDD